MADNTRARAHLAAQTIMENVDKLGGVDAACHWLETSGYEDRIFFKKVTLDGMNEVVLILEAPDEDHTQMLSLNKQTEVAARLCWEHDENHPPAFGVDVNPEMVASRLKEITHAENNRHNAGAGAAGGADTTEQGVRP